MLSEQIIYLFTLGIIILSNTNLVFSRLLVVNEHVLMATCTIYLMIIIIIWQLSNYIDVNKSKY